MFKTNARMPRITANRAGESCVCGAGGARGAVGGLGRMLSYTVKNPSPLTVRRTDSSQCVAPLHLGLVLRHFDDIVVHAGPGRRIEASIDRVERSTEARNGGRDPEGRIGDDALNGA